MKKNWMIALIAGVSACGVLAMYDEQAEPDRAARPAAGAAAAADAAAVENGNEVRQRQAFETERRNILFQLRSSIIRTKMGLFFNELYARYERDPLYTPLFSDTGNGPHFNIVASFIYPWENEENPQADYCYWMHEDLCALGIQILAGAKFQEGGDLHHFIGRLLEMNGNPNKHLFFACSRKAKIKAQQEGTVLSREYSGLLALRSHPEYRRRIWPLFLEGSTKTSFPFDMADASYIDFRCARNDRGEAVSEENKKRYEYGTEGYIKSLVEVVRKLLPIPSWEGQIENMQGDLLEAMRRVDERHRREDAPHNIFARGRAERNEARVGDVHRETDRLVDAFYEGMRLESGYG